jgi:hypothetical protein
MMETAAACLKDIDLLKSVTKFIERNLAILAAYDLGPSKLADLSLSVRQFAAELFGIIFLLRSDSEFWAKVEAAEKALSDARESRDRARRYPKPDWLPDGWQAGDLTPDRASRI